MFWRRRKLPEDDQPLVPHGLISQALVEQASEELPPDMWDNSPKDVVRAPVAAANVSLRAAGSPSAHTEPAEISAEQGKISPPMRWPRVDEAEVARRAQLIDAAVSFPYRKPLVGAAVPKTIDPSPVQEPVKLELVASSSSIQAPASRPTAWRKLIARLSTLRLPSISEKWRSVRNARILADLKPHVASRLQETAQRFDELRQKSIPSLDAARLKLMDKSHAAISQSRSGIQRVRERIRALDTPGVTRAWNRARSLQVTVRIPRSDFKVLRSLAGRANISRFRVPSALQRDSRLWGSMTMAALSAMLALGVISSLRHYGPGDAQPAGSGTVHASTSRNEPPGSSVTPKPVASDGERKPSPTAKAGDIGHASVAKAAVQVSKKEASSHSVDKPKVRRNRDEDDYVAKDTYVYYGNSGKRSR